MRSRSRHRRSRRRTAAPLRSTACSHRRWRARRYGSRRSGPATGSCSQSRRRPRTAASRPCCGSDARTSCAPAGRARTDHSTRPRAAPCASRCARRCASTAPRRPCTARSPVAGSVAPARPGSHVAVVVSQGAKQIGQRQPTLGGDSRFHFSVPAPGLGVYDVQVTVPATGSYAQGATRTRVHARFPELRYGPDGAGRRRPAPAAARARLPLVRDRQPVRLRPGGRRARVPEGAGARAHRRRRAGALVGARHARSCRTCAIPGQGDHLEVDKTQQVLLVVHAGKVVWISPVSTGGPGKYTPEGTFDGASARSRASIPRRSARCGTRCTSPAATRCTATPRCPRTRRATAACACRCGSGRCCTPSVPDRRAGRRATSS